MSIKTLVDGSDLQQAHRLTWFLETPCKGWRRFTIPLDPKKMFGYHKTYLKTPLLQVFDGIWRSLDVYGYQVGFPNYYCNRMFQLIALVWRWHMLTIHTPRCSQRTWKNLLHWCSTKICPFNWPELANWICLYGALAHKSPACSTDGVEQFFSVKYSGGDTFTRQFINFLSGGITRWWQLKHVLFSPLPEK